ncbi:MAG: hypothetical protein AAGI15_06500 [Pseudomonadota bacterium]
MSLRPLLALTLIFVSGGCMAAAPGYKSWFRAELVPKEGIAQAYIRIEQAQAQVELLKLRMPESAYTLEDSDGTVTREGDQVIWQVPADGGRLRYRYRIANQRENGAFDARLTEAGGLFRGDDLFPPAAVTTKDGALATARVRIDVPEGWSVQTQYGSATNRSRRVSNPERRFDRPTGWMIAGPLGVRIEEIAERTVVAAGLRGEQMRRNDLLAFLRWNLPELVDAAGTFPPRVLIVGADDPFWRGGLSASRSFYLHVDRPMIGEDGTSTLLHELVHIATGISAAGNEDWLVEGLAEYYSLEIMRRSNTISQARFDKAMAGIAEDSAHIDGLATAGSSGDVTRRAVAGLHALAEAMKTRHGIETGLDPLLQGLVEIGAPVTLDAFDALGTTLGIRDDAAFEALLALARKPAPAKD